MRVVGWLLWVLLFATCSPPSPSGDTVPLRTLTVRVQGDGAGHVRSVPLGIDCGQQCTTQLPQGTQIEITATAQAGSIRAPFEGCPTPRGDLCQITLTQDTTLDVRFDIDVGPPVEYVRLQIDRQGGGRLTADLPPPFDCGSICRADVPKGQTLKLFAVPDRDHYFAGWGGACQGADPTCEIWVKDAVHVLALFSPKVCVHPNFCWDNPIPTGRPASGVIAFADDDILVATDDRGGAFLRWNGTGWMAQPDNLFVGSARGALTRFWASARNDIWAVDQTALWHFDGATFTRQTLSSASFWPISAVHGRAASDVWAVGASGASFHFDGTTWTPQPTGITAQLSALWVAPDGTAWAGAEDATLLFWNGTTWSRVSQPLTGYFRKITGSSKTDVWAVLSTGMLHFDGTSWSEAVTAPRLTDIQVLAPDNIWGHNGVQAYHNDGTGWLAYTVGPKVMQLVATAKDVWAFGERGQILRREGATFRSMYSGVQRARPNLNSTVRLNQVYMTDADHAWAVGDGGTLLRFDGMTWTQQDIDTTEDLLAIAGAGPSDIWVAGRTSLLHFDGKSWQSEPMSVVAPGDSVLDLYIRPGGPLVFITQGEGVYERVGWGAYRTHMTPSSASIFNSICLYGTGGGEAWLIRQQRLYAWRGGTWVEQTVPGTTNLGCGGGLSSTDHWFTSLYGYDWYHYNGSRIDGWYRTSLFDMPVRRVLPIGPNNIRALQVLNDGLGHYDGTAWRLDFGFRVSLLGGDTRGGRAFVVGTRGAILSYRP